MLSRTLVLVVIWLAFSAVATLLRGVQLRRGSAMRSALWLATVILCGDVWALLTFGRPLEVAVLSLIAFLHGLWWIRHLPNWNGLGQTTWSFSILATLFYLLYNFAVTAFTPLHPLGFLLSCLLFFVELLALGMSLSFTYETLDVCTRLRWRHEYGPAKPIPGYAPKVSLHVPAYNEPPEVLEATLRTLAKLDYANFEVLLVDNNTPDEATWRPLEALCRELGPNFKCLHLDKWPGYKSGALNFALTQTAPDAEIIGIIDADYQVKPKFLRETVPYFSNPRVAFLQTPQDYREYEGNAYLEACYDAYKYFFEVSMPSRNEHNAIIFGGTMGLIRKSALQEIGGWDEWCITEDAEASLRILKRGYRSIYINQTYGRGIMPLNFEGLKKQRFRWCFGGIQILRKHWEALMPWARWVDPANRLTPAQQYYYLAGGVQWYNELLTLVFTVLLLLGGLTTVFNIGIGVRPLQGALVVVPLIFLVLGLWRFLWALRHTLKLSWGRALRAMGNFFSLSWVVTLGSLQGLIQPRGVFLRTPKAKSHSGLVRALRVTQWECGFGLACAGIGLALIVTNASLMVAAVTLLLFWQASFYLAAPAYSLMSVRGEVQPMRLTSRGDIHGRIITESRASRWAFALIVLLLIGYGLLRLLPEPAATPKYAQFQPVAIQPQELIGLPPLPTATLIPKVSPTAVPASATPTPSPLPSRPTQQVPTPTLPFLSPPTETPSPAQPPAETQSSPTDTPSTPTQTPTQPSPTPPLPTPTSTQRPLPTQVPTQVPLPTQAPTQPPLPTQAPTQPPLPAQVPTLPPIPTRPPRTV
jgi:cellulose synthase/poly-beta-1,6-N-acetylglucosamine synthase-like glycosyltransferase